MIFSQILACLMAAAILTLAFWLLKKKQPVLCTVTAAIAAVVLLAPMFAKKAVFVFKDTLTAEQFLCWLFAAAFLRLAYDFIKQKDSAAYAFLIFIVAAFTCFCGLSGVQAILKTHVLFRVTESLNSYGEKLDAFQGTMAEMKQNLDTQQTSIATAQTNLDLQQHKLSDMEYWVKHLYGMMTNETINASDLDRVWTVPKTNGYDMYIVRLGKAPIPKSVQISVHGKTALYAIPQQRLTDGNSSQNIISFELPTGVPKDDISLLLDYVIDSRETNIYQTMPRTDVVFTKEGFTIKVKR